MSRILENIEKLQYYNKVSKLCYRVLKNCQVRENPNLNGYAAVFVSNKNMHIEINTSLPFFEKDEHIQFALLHEALHIVFGHTFLDYTLYDIHKLNDALDASINPYLINYIDASFLSSILEKKEGKFISGYSHIYEKNTWEYIYNNFPETQETNITQNKTQDEDTSKEEQLDKNPTQEDTSQEEQLDENPTQEDTSQEEQLDENVSQDEETQQEEQSKEEDSFDVGQQNNFTQDNTGDESLDGEDNNTGDQESENTQFSETSEGDRSGSGSGFDQGEVIPFNFDRHEFTETASKALQATIQQTVLTSMEELDIAPGSEFGQHIISGLSFHQTAKQKWRRLLSKAVLKAIKIRGIESTWLKPNRRASGAIPIPGKRKLYYPSIGVLIDCSGSMLSYTKDILNHIITITTETGGIDYLIGGDVEEKINQEHVTKKKLHNIELRGFGGTMLTSMIEKLAKKPIDIMIMITDMYLNNEDIQTIQNISKRKSVILCVPNDPYIEKVLTTIPKAKVIRIDKEE